MKVTSMKVIVRGAVAGWLLTTSFAASAVVLEKGEKRWSVSNSHYTIGLDAGNGYQLRWVAEGKSEKLFRGGLAFGYDMQPAEYTGLAAAPDVPVGRRDAEAKVLKDAPDGVVLEVKWGDRDSTVVETMTFDDTPVVGVSVKLDWKRAVGSVSYQMSMEQGHARPDRTKFYPESRNALGIHERYRQGEHSAMPRWKHLKDGEDFGFGVVADESSRWENFVYATRKGAAGFWGTGAWIDLYAEHLADEPVPNSRRYDLKLVFAADEQVTHRVANGLLKSAPEIQLCDIVPDKVVSKRGKGNGLTTTIVNNTEADRSVRVRVELATGFDRILPVSDEVVTLKAGEMRPYARTWAYDRDLEWGVASRVSVLDAQTGRLLDYRADVTAVHDRGFAAAGVSIQNSGNCIQDGMEETWADMLRCNYIGMMEYYAWSPSTWDPEYKAGQAPEGDSWEPCSDSSQGSRTRISKKFLKTFIDEAHKRGVDMYDWITGLVNYRQAVANPTKFQYGANGQMLIYSSRIWGDNDRFAVAKIAPYTVEDARDWGEQTAASVDMFGWDGCRWDWGWTPCVPNDPLYHNVEGVSSKDLEWFNWEGKSCYELYPDSDATAYACYRAWIGAIRKRHPNFVNTANCYPSKEAFAGGKRYLAEFLRDGMGLLEYLIGFDGNPKCNTFSKWTKELAEASNRMRKLGCHSEVGHIWSFARNSTAAQYARYACHAAGSKWWGGPGDCRYWTAKHRSLPFAMRFSEYFWSTEFTQVEDEAERCRKVSVVDGDRLLWKDFVFERTKDGTRELVLHVVNVGGDEHFYVRRAPSVPVENLKVRVALGKGERTVECWALAPGDEPTATKLEVRDGAVTLPRMEEAVCFVFRIAR